MKSALELVPVDSSWPVSRQRGTPPYLRPWLGADREGARLDSAVALVAAAMTTATVSREHLKRVVELLLWDLTEADGKYQLRYRSEGTRLLGDRLEWQRVLRHEHVFERRILRDKLLALDVADPEQIRSVLAESVACVVTVEEDARLRAVQRQALTGWDRYAAAGIKVWDFANEPAIALQHGVDE